ncbi:MAG: aminotransferase class I/II-fold pyridoxal phosphate-dependent enzyme [Candidatus Aminicenantes bacterium]|nr:aminotransferase class I/II-fold pyridoxal phosphate-dependent enzyme [Candidatus Aminicenantes bacterium]
MKIEVFEMERWQSKWENVVDYNLSESGVHSLLLEELVDPKDLDRIHKTKLGYIQTDGTPELKKSISSLYTNVSPDNILVTSGSAEANFVLMWKLIEPGDEVAFMLPNFMQMGGLTKMLGARMKPFYLREDLDWNPDPKELKKTVTKETKIIVVTNPNNPTGGQLSEESRQLLIDLAEWAGAWIISDEVYQGAEYDGEMTPSFWGTYKKAFVTCGLSKAYGLPGLRVGWIVTPEEHLNDIWPYKDYTSITISAVSNRLACIALSPEKRTQILERTRNIIRRNYAVLEDWMKKQGDLFHCTPPKAGAIAFPKYKLDINATELATRIRESKSVLIQPGDQFGMDHHIRFGLGEDEAYFKKGLSLVAEGLTEIKQEA